MGNYVKKYGWSAVLGILCFGLLLVYKQSQKIDFGTAVYNSMHSYFMANNNQDYFVQTISGKGEFLWNGRKEDQPFREIFGTETWNGRYVAMTDRYVTIFSTAAGREQIQAVRLEDKSCQVIWQNDYLRSRKVYFLGLLTVEEGTSNYSIHSEQIRGMFVDGDSIFLIRDNRIDRLDGASGKLLDSIEDVSRFSYVSCQNHTIYYADSGCVLRAYNYQTRQYQKLPEILAVDFYVRGAQMIYQDLKLGGDLVWVDLYTEETRNVTSNADQSYALGEFGIYYLDPNRTGIYRCDKTSGVIEQVVKETVYFFDVVCQTEGDLLIYQTAEGEIKEYRDVK